MALPVTDNSCWIRPRSSRDINRKSYIRLISNIMLTHVDIVFTFFLSPLLLLLQEVNPFAILRVPSARSFLRFDSAWLTDPQPQGYTTQYNILQSLQGISSCRIIHLPVSRYPHRCW